MPGAKHATTTTREDDETTTILVVVAGRFISGKNQKFRFCTDRGRVSVADVSTTSLS